MNPREEQELHREEGENLLEQLTRLTEEDKLVWTCARATFPCFCSGRTMIPWSWPSSHRTTFAIQNTGMT